MSPSLSLLGCAMLCALTLGGLAWPIAARLTLPPAEKLLAAFALSLIGIFCAGWLIYLLVLPPRLFWALPAMAALGLLVRWRDFRSTTNDPVVRALLVAQGLVTVWCVGWLATITSYSGGGWAGDWFEHWERAGFFLEHGPVGKKFLGQYAVTARPPLANVVTGAFLALTRIDFAHYQLVSTLLASLAFAPAALLAARWDSGRAIAILAVLAMLNPLFVQNATFAWTKLPAAFFVLTALVFFLRTNGVDPPRAAAPLCGACLGAGMLAHYSAGPYVVMLAVGWIFLGWPRRGDPVFWRGTVFAGLAGALLLAMWFAWSLATFGTHGTFLTNPSVTSSDARQGNQLLKMALNFFDTLAPHFLRPLDTSLITQRSTWGAFRDWFFQSYQLNLPLAFGSVAWVALIRELARSWRAAVRRDRMFWTVFVAGVVVLGTATHGQRDHWGLTHICLQALVILGLAWLAARWTSLGRAWRIALVGGAVIDFVFGIALHFGVQSFALERWLAPGRSLDDTFATLSQAGQMNLVAKITHRVGFLSDVLSAPFAAILLVLALMFALQRVRRLPVQSGS